MLHHDKLKKVILLSLTLLQENSCNIWVPPHKYVLYWKENENINSDLKMGSSYYQGGIITENFLGSR
jgi:hypothetical protein